MAKVEKLLEQARAHLEADEEVLFSILGAYEAKVLGSDSVRNGVLIATDRRLVFYAKKLGGYDLESFPYRQISSFEGGKSMMGHHVKIFASGNNVQVKWMKSDISQLMSIVREKMHAQQVHSAPVAQPVPAIPDEDHGAALRKLAALRDEGLITPEEYESKRAEVLARL